MVIKSLPWTGRGTVSDVAQVFYGMYIVGERGVKGSGEYFASIPSPPMGSVMLGTKSVEAAKLACERHYQKNIEGCLTQA
jgi:hypothetical protein